MIFGQSVRDSHELRRIASLPRRVITPELAEARAAELTRILRRPGSNAALKKWQGLALHEIMTRGGAYLGLPVGQGKTLLLWLACLVLDAKRPVIGMPAGLRDDALRFYAGYTRDWYQPNPSPMIVTYEEMTNVDAVDKLDQIDPDVILLDEADCLRNPKSSARKRLGRFVKARRPKLVAATGTPGRLSILDYSFLIAWALGEFGPVPRDQDECAMWAAALDEKGPRRGGMRPGWGPLVSLSSDPAKCVDLDGARDAFCERLHATEGVVIVDEDSCDQPLTFRQVLAPEDPILDSLFATFRATWTTPDGWDLSDPLSVWRHAGELGTGMYLRWDPRPPTWWTTPRSVFCKFVQKRIVDSSHGHHPLDTELAVRNAHGDAEEVRDWMAVRDRFRPNSVPVWTSGTVLEQTARWSLDTSTGPGLVWCGNTAFAQALAQVTGLTYYGAGGKSVDGRSISNAPPEMSAILSVGANLRGRNLQAWYRNRVVNPPQSARYIEQLVGRTHRHGQTRPVEIDIVMTSGDTFDSFDAAYREALFSARTNGIHQKLLRATVVRATPQITEANQYRWATKSGMYTP